MKNLKKIVEFFEQHNSIDFALVFGSHATNKSHPFSDIDIGIYTNNKIELFELGAIVSTIELLINKPVDLVILNDLFKKKPDFAYQIVKDHRLIYCRDRSTYIDFKTNAVLYYLDQKPLIDSVKEAFFNRLNENQFGKRNYVSKASTIRR